MRLLDYKGRAIASSVAFLVSAYVAAEIPQKAKGPCAGRRLEPSLVCIPAEFGDLGFVDHLIMVAAGIVIAMSLWFVMGNLGPPRGQRTASRSSLS